MIYAPNHIKKYVKLIEGKNKFFHNNFDEYEFTFHYEVICSCGNNRLVVYKNSEPKVIACCESCGNTITLYDLIEYPCAETAREPEEALKKMTLGDNDKFNVAVIFEYSDEFEFDDDAFDENDVTWCQIYLYDPKGLQSIMIVDDETA